LRRRVVFLAFACAFLALGAFLVSCGGDDGNASGANASNGGSAPTAAPTGAGGGAPQEVRMAEFSYSPASLTARAGQTLTLTVRNSGSEPHTFTISGVVDSGPVNPGEQKTVTFTPSSAGALTFFCTIHGRGLMSGQLTVG